MLHRLREPGVLLFVAAVLVLACSPCVAAEWRDAGIYEEETTRAVHVFERTASDGQTYYRVFVPIEVELGGILVTRLIYLEATDGRTAILASRLRLVGLGPNWVELYAESGTVRTDIVSWESVKDRLTVHWAMPIKPGDEPAQRLRFSVASGTPRLLLSGLYPVVIEVRRQGNLSYLTTDARLML